MASIAVFVGDLNPRDDHYYQDGDIISAYNKRRIENKHVSEICHPWNFGFNSDGNRPDTTLAKWVCDRTYRSRFERVSQHEVRKIDLVTGKEVGIFGHLRKNPAERTIYVQQYITLGKKILVNGEWLPFAGHKIFGPEGSEFWYGGKISPDRAKLDVLWPEIELVTGKMRADHQLYPHSEKEKKHFLILPVDEMSDSELMSLKAPELGNPVSSERLGKPDEYHVVKKRSKKIDRNSLDRMTQHTKNKITDRSIPMDFRVFDSWARADIVITK